MRTHLNYIAFAIIAAIMWSCDSGKDYDFFVSKYYLEPEVTTVNIGADYDATAEFKVNSDCSWKVEKTSGGDWLAITPNEGNGNGTISLKVTESNKTMEQDQATVTITSINDSKIKQTVTVIRDGAVSNISVDPVTITFNSLGQPVSAVDTKGETIGATRTFNITSNVSWEIKYDESIIAKISATEGKGNASVTIEEVKPNTSTTALEGKITVYNSINDKDSRVIKIIQEPYEPHLSIDKASLTFYDFGPDKAQTIYLSSSDAWSIKALAQDWLHVEPAQGVAEADVAVKIWVDPLTDNTKDEGKVIFTNDKAPNVSLTVIRETIQLSSYEIRFANYQTGQTITFDVTSGQNWTINTSDSDWVTFSPASGGTNTTTVTVTAKSDNESTDNERVATFNINGTDRINTKITIIQPTKPRVPNENDNNPPEINQ